MQHLELAIGVVILTVFLIKTRRTVINEVLSLFIGAERLKQVNADTQQFIEMSKGFFAERNPHEKFLKAVDMLEVQNRFFLWFGLKFLIENGYFLFILFCVRQVFRNKVIANLPLIGDVTWFPIFLATVLVLFLLDLVTAKLKKMKRQSQMKNL
jgi:hypothetical protein